MTMFYCKDCKSMHSTTGSKEDEELLLRELRKGHKGHKIKKIKEKK